MAGDAEPESDHGHDVHGDSGKDTHNQTNNERTALHRTAPPPLVSTLPSRFEAWLAPPILSRSAIHWRLIVKNRFAPVVPAHHMIARSRVLNTQRSCHSCHDYRNSAMSIGSSDPTKPHELRLTTVCASRQRWRRKTFGYPQLKPSIF